MHKSLVVLANSRTCLNAKYAKKEVKEKIIRLDQLNARIKEIEAASRENEMSNDMMKEVAESFLSVSAKNSSDYAKKYEELVAAVEHNAKKSDAESCAKEEIKEELEKIPESNIQEKDKLISELKKFRLELSRAEGLKPYYIFTDAQMNELIEKKPETKEQMLQVSGFGKVKVEKYGESIVKILNNI